MSVSLCSMVNEHSHVLSCSLHVPSLQVGPCSGLGHRICVEVYSTKTRNRQTLNLKVNEYLTFFIILFRTKHNFCPRHSTLIAPSTYPWNIFIANQNVIQFLHYIQTINFFLKPDHIKNFMQLMPTSMTKLFETFQCF